VGEERLRADASSTAREQPNYTTGFSVVLACAWILVISSVIMAVGLHRENKRRDRGERDWRLSLPAEELTNLGDDHPAFRYTL
jgi:hypothetical protein